MRWPWQREPERRQSVPFTDAVVAALTAQASGAAVGDASAIAALEAAVALYSRAFSAVKLSPAVPALSPGCLALIARNLIRRGEDVHRAHARPRHAIRLQPIGSWDVRGGPVESSWWYRCDRFGPSGNLTELVPAGAVLHVRYAVDSCAAVVRDRPARVGTVLPEPSRRISKRGSARKRAAPSGTCSRSRKTAATAVTTDPLAPVQSRHGRREGADHPRRDGGERVGRGEGRGADV